MRAFSGLLAVFASLVAQPSLAYERTIYIPRSVMMYSQQYNFSSDNINALLDLKQKHPDIKVRLGKIVLSPGDDGSILCRTWFPISPAEKLPFGEFIKAALISELTEAGIYSESEGRALSLQFESIDFSSFGAGKWSFRASLSVENKEAQMFSHEHRFELAFAASPACRAVARAFMPSVQGFLKSIYHDTRFQELIFPASVVSTQQESSPPLVPPQTSATTESNQRAD